ncbi:MAG: 4Fe-4S binding protein, partial [Eubacteriales bacterium]
MCDNHQAGEASWIRRLIMWVYGEYVGDTLDFYMFLARLGGAPLIGGAVRFFAHQYGKYLHGGRAATVEECMEILSRAGRITVVDCACREKNNQCEKPRRTCLVINTGAGLFGKHQKQNYISLEEAGEIISNSYNYGLIRSITHCMTPNLYAICNCCPCCCVPYRLRTEFGIRSAVENGNYSASIDTTKCKKCRECIKTCSEKAVNPDSGVVDTDKCLGCGLCLGSCRHGALKMVKRVNPTPVLTPGPVEKVLMYTAFFS